MNTTEINAYFAHSKLTSLKWNAHCTSEIHAVNNKYIVEDPSVCMIFYFGNIHSTGLSLNSLPQKCLIKTWWQSDFLSCFLNLIDRIDAHIVMGCWWLPDHLDLDCHPILWKCCLARRWPASGPPDHLSFLHLAPKKNNLMQNTQHL